MNRIITALAISGMFVAAVPAFAKTVSNKTSVAKAGDEKAPAGDKAAEGSTDAAPAKTKKHHKKAAKTEGSSEKPAEAPAK